MIYAVQQAIYAQLSALSVDVYDHVPQGSDYALVVIGDTNSNASDTDTETGFNGLLTINSYASSATKKGFEDVSAIMLEIYNLLHRHDLIVPNYGVSTLYQEFNTLLRDPDGITRHGVQRFRIIYEYTGA